MSLNHITAVPGIGKPKYIQIKYVPSKNISLAFALLYDLIFLVFGFVDSLYINKKFRIPE